MQLIEILVIIACVLIVAGVTISVIINKKKGKNSCGCDCANCSGCSSRREKAKKDNSCDSENNHKDNND